MEISWIGRTCFRLRGREGAVLTDPVSAATGYTLGRVNAEIVTLSQRDDPDASNVAGVRGEPRVFDAPGEYEVRGILVTGIPLPRAEGGRTMAFLCEIDGVTVAHLGLPDAPPAADALARFEGVDVLLLPVGGGASLGASEAAELMRTIDPRIVAPMHYRTERERADLAPLDRFLSEAGASPEPLPRLNVTRANVPGELTVEVLKPRGA